MLRKVAVVTGAAQGIGERTAEVLAAKGYAMILADIQSCATALRAVVKAGQTGIEMLGDISEEAMAEAIRAGNPISQVMGASYEHMLKKN